MTHLLFLGGPLAGKRFALEADRVSVGRDPRSDLCLDDPSVAPKHLMLIRVGGDYQLHVHASKPPTQLNGRPVIKADLSHGDQLRIGTVELCYVSTNSKPGTRGTAAEPFELDSDPEIDLPRQPPSTSAPRPAAGTLATAGARTLAPAAPVRREPFLKRLKRWAVITGGLAVLVGLLAGSAWLFTRDGGSPPRPSEKRSPEKENRAGEEEVPNAAVTQPPSLPVGAGPSGLRAGFKVHRTKNYPSHQAAVDAAQPGDSVVFDSRDDKPIVVNRRIEDVQFLSGSATWELHADLADCQFLFHEAKQFIQKEGKLERVAFFRCPMKEAYLTHTDAVSFYFGPEQRLTPKDNPDGRPQLHLTGFVRGMLILKPISGSLPGGGGFEENGVPALVLDATDPVGNGTGSYVLSPAVWGQRAGTPFRIERGVGVTFAHVSTDGNVWADPVLEVGHGTDCVVLCTSFGGQRDAAEILYSGQPRKLKYRGHEEWGHDNPGPPYRGAVICVAGQRNRVVAHGDATKTWTIGRRASLPGLHYADGILAADPFLRQFAAERGGVSINFAEPRNVFLARRGKSGYEFVSSVEDRPGQPYYPLDGPDLIRPVFVPLKDLRLSPGEFHNLAVIDMTGKDGDEIQKALAQDRSVYLGPGIYEFKKPLARGFVVGAGIEQTVLKWPAGIDCATRSCRGLLNCTVRGGRYGYNSHVGDGARTVGPSTLLLRTRFEGQREACVNLHASQYQTWQDCEFVGAKVGFTQGHDRSAVGGKGGRKGTGAEVIDKVNLANCTFRNIAQRGIELNPTASTLGQVGVHNCRFEDVGGAAIQIHGGQTHLVQLCQFARCAKGGGPVVSVQSSGVAALSHLEIDNAGVSGTPTGVALRGTAVVSHCTIGGVPVALRSAGVLTADHVSAPDGVVEAPKDSLLCRCRLKNLDLPNGVGRGTGSGFADVSDRAGTPALDVTPPPEVAGVRVKSIQKVRHVEWDAASDPESGVLQYVIYSRGQEIARTPLQYDPAAEDGPFVKGKLTLKFLDPDPTHTDYAVKAVNGAGLISGGGPAPRRWVPVRGRFLAKDGTEQVIKNFVRVGKDFRAVVEGEPRPLPFSQLGIRGLPNVLYVE